MMVSTMSSFRERTARDSGYTELGARTHRVCHRWWHYLIVIVTGSSARWKRTRHEGIVCLVVTLASQVVGPMSDAFSNL